MKTVTVTLLSKPGCHLCDDAREVINAVLADFRTSGASIHLDEKNILDDAKLARKHAEDIPVVFVGNKRHAIYRVDAERFRAVLERKL